MILWGIFYIIATFLLGYFFIKEKKVIELTKKFEDNVLKKISLEGTEKDNLIAKVLTLIALIVMVIFFFLVDKTPDRYIQMKLIGVYGIFIINLIFYVLRKEHEYILLTNLVMLFLGRLMFNILDLVFYIYLSFNMLFALALIYFSRKETKQELSVDFLKQEARKDKNKLNPNKITEETVEIERRKRSTIGIALSRITTTVLAIVIVGVIQNFYIGNYVIPSGSMEPIIMVKDRVFANMAKYKFVSPKVGEIIAFKEPKDNQVMYTKRITGAPGTTLQIVNGKMQENDKEQVILNRSYATEGIFYNNKIYVPKKGDKVSINKIIMLPKLVGKTTDGKVISAGDFEAYYNGQYEELSPEQFLEKIGTKQNFKNIIGIDDGYVKDDPTKEFYYTFTLRVEGRNELVLPILDFKYDDATFMKLLNGEKITLTDDYYMAMGDNTENSYDSRYFGYVAKSRIKGQLLFRWWPFDRIGIL